MTSLEPRARLRISLIFLVGCIVLGALLLGSDTVGGAAKKTVHLTFDDGPQKGTEEVLGVLKELEAPATFFLTGSNQASLGGSDSAARQKDLIQRILKEKHAVGNHAYNHVPQTKKEYADAYGELKTDAQKMAFRKNLSDNVTHFRKLLDDSGFQFTLVRLPGDGRLFPRYLEEIKNIGMKHVSWDFEFAPNGVFGWVPHNNWQGVDGVAASHVGLPQDGAIILFHDRHWQGNHTALLKKLLT